MSNESIKIEIADAVGILTIDRPDALNALDSSTLNEFAAKFADLERNSLVRVIVITGAGDRAFVAGGDISDLNSRRGLSHYLEFAELIHGIFRQVELCDKPTVSAIKGWALGGGTELLLVTDIRIAAEGAKFGLPEIKLGLFPGAGGSQRLIRQIAPCKARELMFMGDHIDAAEAEKLGLINKITDKANLMDQTMEFARRIACHSPLVLKLLKRNLTYGMDMPLSAALAHEQAMIGLVLDSEDAHEGCSAFLEKREAQFLGQ